MPIKNLPLCFNGEKSNLLTYGSNLSDDSCMKMCRDLYEWYKCRGPKLAKQQQGVTTLTAELDRKTMIIFGVMCCKMISLFFFFLQFLFLTLSFPLTSEPPSQMSEVLSGRANVPIFVIYDYFPYLRLFSIFAIIFHICDYQKVGAVSVSKVKHGQKTQTHFQSG